MLGGWHDLLMELVIYLEMEQSTIVFFLIFVAVA
jgi:predicted RNA-binding protein